MSDLTGKFRLTNLPPKTYQLRVTASDYKPLIRSDVAVGTAQSVKLTLELVLDGASASEITVSATTFFIKSDEFKLSTNTLSQEEIRRAPGSVEDVSLNNPGVFSPRLSASRDVLPTLKLNAAIGLYHQAPPMIWLLSFSQNRNLQFLQTRQLAGGLEFYPSEDLMIKTIATMQQAWNCRKFPTRMLVLALAYLDSSRWSRKVSATRAVSSFFAEKESAQARSYSLAAIRIFTCRRCFLPVGGVKVEF